MGRHLLPVVGGWRTLPQSDRRMPGTLSLRRWLPHCPQPRPSRRTRLLRDDGRRRAAAQSGARAAAERRQKGVEGLGGHLVGLSTVPRPAQGRASAVCQHARRVGGGQVGPARHTDSGLGAPQASAPRALPRRSQLLARRRALPREAPPQLLHPGLPRLPLPVAPGRPQPTPSDPPALTAAAVPTGRVPDPGRCLCVAVLRWRIAGRCLLLPP
mmetsp:Transcript_41746/g.138399  ORF Transcript_41746/g.138399 Transcript_41746/m.138399 type:complete len:213 (+) Transcript_41746:588-1226(+)